MNPVQFVLFSGVLGFGVAGLLQLIDGRIGMAVLMFALSFACGTIGGLLMNKRD